MKSYKVWSKWWPENKTPEPELKGLQMRVKVVKCRKRCFCNCCKSGIVAGDMALKTSQYRQATNRMIRNAYCEKCFQIEEE